MNASRPRTIVGIFASRACSMPLEWGVRCSGVLGRIVQPNNQPNNQSRNAGNTMRSLHKTLCSFWREDAGFVLSTEMIIVLTLVVVAVIAAFTALREAIVTEMADTGASLARLNQSYAINGVSSHSSFGAGSLYLDSDDFCDRRGLDGDRCVLLRERAAPGEGL